MAHLPSSTLPNEPDLVERARQGDKQAYRALMEAYQDRVYRLILSMVQRPAEAEDLTQEVFIKAYFALSNFEGQSAFYTWLFRIASNHCLDYLRKRRLPEISIDRPLDGEQDSSHAERLEAPEMENPDGGLEGTGIMAPLLKVLDPDERLLLTLRELEGYSYEELAKELKCGVNTIKSRLNRARSALKEAYERAYGNIVEPKTVQNSGEKP